MTTQEREDALTLGVRLRAEEALRREERIMWALKAKDNDPNWSKVETIRYTVAEALYDAKYPAELVGQPPTAEEILDIFCVALFDANFAEVLEAYDRMLG